MQDSEAPPLFLQAWRSLLTAYSRLVPRIDRDLEAARGLSLAWYDVLLQLFAAPGRRLRMHELADAVLLSKSGLTRLVDRIEAAGLVTRSAVPGDRRSVYVRLTRPGLRAVAAALPLVRESVARHFGRHLTQPELTLLRDALTRVANTPEHDPDPPTPAQA